MNAAARAIADLLTALGYDLSLVAEVHSTPTELTVHTYALNAEGKKYCHPGTSDVARSVDTHPLSWSKEFAA